MQASQLEKQARTLLSQGNIQEAVKIGNALLQQFPNRAGSYLLCAELAVRQNNTRQAIALAAKAVELTPGDAHSLARLAYFHLIAQNVGQALEHAHRAMALNPQSAQVCDFLGSVLSACHDHSNAKMYFERACNTDPDNPHYLYNLSMELRFLGDNENSEKLINKVLTLKPDEYEGYLQRAGLRTQTSDHNHIAELKSVLAKGIPSWRGAIQVQYALAKEYEDIGDYESAFTHLQAGADLRWQHTQYDVQRDLDTVDQLIACFTAEKMSAPTTGLVGNAPIFIVGMPRTGTTLVERILDKHSQLASGGELQDFAMEMVKLVGTNAGGAPPPREELIERSLEINFKALGSAYVDAARQRVGDSPRFIDKLPLNYLYCGLIHRALPEATIIHLRRHPIDTCYAIYKTLFKHAYPFSYNLEALGAYYCGYRRLMDHWHRVLPGRIYDITYEDLVADQENQSRGLLEACNLPWEDACLQFHSNTSASTTASATQVRQPIYNTSVGRWRCYQQQLEPLIGVLQQHGIRWD